MIDQDDPEIQDAIAKGVAKGIRLAKEEEAEEAGRVAAIEADAQAERDRADEAARVQRAKNDAWEAKRLGRRKHIVSTLKIAFGVGLAVVVFGMCADNEPPGSRRDDQTLLHSMVYGPNDSPVRWVTPRSANVRTGPGTDHDIVSTLSNSSRLAVVIERDGWSQIQAFVDGKLKEGWIRSDLLGSKQDAEMAVKLAENRALCASTDPSVLDPLVYKYVPVGQVVLVHEHVWNQLAIDTKENTRRYFRKCKNVWEIKSASSGKTLAKSGLWGSKVYE